MAADDTIVESLAPQSKLPPLPSGFQPAQQQPTRPDASTLELPQKFDPSQMLTHVRPELIDSIIQQESGGRADALGRKGERGLMQIEAPTAAQYGVSPDMLMNPQVNRNVGERYFGDLLKKYKGNEFLALVAYNEGPGRVDSGKFFPQSVKYATSILGRAGSRIGKFLGNAIEGTAYAEELPPLPSGFQPKATAQPTAQPSASTTEVPQQQLPPTPSGFQPQFQMRPQVRMGPGGLSIGLTGETTPTAIKTQESAANVVLGQVADAIKFYDTNIKPRESQFTGSLFSDPESALRGYAQWPEYHRSRLTSMLGMKGDPAVMDFYSKTGPVIAEQMRSLIGGRVGQYMLQGPLAPHIPNPENDDLPTMRKKLESLKTNVPIILKNINNMRAQGMSDDQIIAAEQASSGGGGFTPSSSDESDLINQYGGTP